MELPIIATMDRVDLQMIQLDKPDDLGYLTFAINSLREEEGYPLLEGAMPPGVEVADKREGTQKVPH